MRTSASRGSCSLVPAGPATRRHTTRSEGQQPERQRPASRSLELGLEGRTIGLEVSVQDPQHCFCVLCSCCAPTPLRKAHFHFKSSSCFLGTSLSVLTQVVLPCSRMCLSSVLLLFLLALTWDVGKHSLRFLSCTFSCRKK